MFRTLMSTFFMKYPQCSTHPVAQLQLEFESAASLRADRKLLQSCVVVLKWLHMQNKYVVESKIFRTGAANCTAVVLAPSTGRW